MKNVTNRTLKNLASKDLENMSQKELKAFAIKAQEVLSTILSNELRKEAAYLELKSCTNYRNTKPAVKEQEQILNLASQEIACGLDLEIAKDYETNGLDALDLAMQEDAANLQGVVNVNNNLVIESVSEDELKYWMNGVNQIDGYAVVDGKQLYFQASSVLAGPTVIGDWKYNRKIKNMIEAKKPGFFKPKWDSIDEYKVYASFKGTKCMVTALNHEKSKFMGYIGEYAWIWNLKKTDFRGNAFKPLITLGKDLVEGRGHNKDFESMTMLREKYTDTIQGLISIHKNQVKSGKKTFPKPVGVESSNVIQNTNMIGGSITGSENSFKLVELSEAEMKKQIANMVFKSEELEVDEPIVVKQKTNKLSLTGEIIF